MSADNDNNDRWWTKSTIREYTEHEIENIKIHYWLLGNFTMLVVGAFFWTIFP